MRFLAMSIVTLVTSMLLPNLEAASLLPLQNKTNEQLVAKGHHHEHSRKSKKSHRTKHRSKKDRKRKKRNAEQMTAERVSSPAYASGYQQGPSIIITSSAGKGPFPLIIVQDQVGTPVGIKHNPVHPDFSSFELNKGVYFVSWNAYVDSNDPSPDLNAISLNVFNATTNRAYPPSPNAFTVIPQFTNPQPPGTLVTIPISGQIIVTIPADGQKLQLQASFQRAVSGGAVVHVANTMISINKIADLD